MKLRQKLAVVLATAMVVTAVPVVTMAASDNYMSKSTLKVQKDTVFTEVSTASQIRVNFKDAYESQNEIFYITLENAKFYDKTDTYVSSQTAYNNHAVETGVTYTQQSDTVMKVEVNYASIKNAQNKTLYFPLFVKTTGGDATAKIERQGSGSTISESSFVFATTGENKLTAVAGDANSFYLTGKLGAVTFSETFKGAAAGKAVEVEYAIQDSDYEFDFTGKSSTQDRADYTRYDLNSDFYKASYGFSSATVSAYVKNNDKGIVRLVITANGSSDSIGRLELKNLPVRSIDKDPAGGDLLVDINSVDSSLSGSLSNVKLGKVVAYSNYIEMKDSKAVEITAGHDKEVTFKIGEYVDDSLIGEREIEITLDNKDAHFLNKTDLMKFISGEKTKGTVSKVVVEYVDDKNHDKGIKKIIVELKDALQKNSTLDWFEIKANICVPIDEKDAKEIKIKAAGRALEADVETVAVTIVNPFDVTVEPMIVKVGLQDQVGGKIVLTETDKAMLSKGKITFALADDSPSGIKLESAGTLTVTGDLQKADFDTDKTSKAAIITIKRQSKSASTLTVSDIKVTVDRTVPEGSYDLVISNVGIDGHSHKYTVKDFFVVGTRNTEEIASNGLKKGTASFVIGEAKYTANGESYNMTAASYIQSPGYTMIPVRYVSEAFGIDGKNVVFSSGSATFFAGERTIQLTNGSDVAIVNGVNIKMATKVVIKDGRTYAPVAEVAKILGISSIWDSAAKTATFTNN